MEAARGESHSHSSGVQPAARRILIADDEHRLANVIALHLENMGERIVLTTAQDALKAIESTRFNLMIIDYILSGRVLSNDSKWTVLSPNGLDVLDAARKSLLNHDSPAILLSGDHDAHSINRAVDHRARILAKPFHTNCLFQLMFELLASSADIEERILLWVARFHFSQRETEFVRMKVRDVSDEDCAKAMGVAKSMIDEYRKLVVRRFNAGRRVAHERELPHFADVLNVFYRAALGLAA